VGKTFDDPDAAFVPGFEVPWLQPIPDRQLGSTPDLSNDMELDPVEECFIVDGPSMGGPSSERFEVCFASPVDVGVVDERKRDQVDRVNLDLAVAHAVVTAKSHLRPPPQPERHRYVTRQHMRTQLSAELHRLTLRQPVVDLDQDASMAGAPCPEKRPSPHERNKPLSALGIGLVPAPEILGQRTLFYVDPIDEPARNRCGQEGE